MSDVVIAGIGQVPVGEHWERSAVEAINAARADAGGLKPQALCGHHRIQSTGILALADHSRIEILVESRWRVGRAAFGCIPVGRRYVDCAIAVGVIPTW